MNERFSRRAKGILGIKAASTETGLGAALNVIGKELKPHFPLAGTIIEFIGFAADGGSGITYAILIPKVVKASLRERNYTRQLFAHFDRKIDPLDGQVKNPELPSGDK